MSEVARRLELLILEDSSVHDAAVLARRSGEDAVEHIAYVVPTSSFSEERLRRHLRDCPEVAALGAVVPITTVPRDAAGLVDTASLARLPVIDGCVLAQVRDAVEGFPGVRSAEVAVEAIPPAAASWHLSELMGDWKRPLVAPTAAGDAGFRPAARAAGRPSIVHGEVLKDLPGDPVRLADALVRSARSPHGIDFLTAEGTARRQSYSELLAVARRVAGSLRHAGLRPGAPILLQLNEPAALLAGFWGAAIGGLVPVPTLLRGDAVATDRLRYAYRALDSPPILTASADAPITRDAARGRAVVLSLEELVSGPVEEGPAEVAPDAPALMLLTSGSSGQPKLVIQTSRSMLGQARASARANHFSADDVSLNWLPLDHVGGLLMFHLRDVVVGCRQIQGPMAAVLQDPLRWLDWIDCNRVTATWAPHFAYALVNARAEELAGRRWDLSCVRFMLNGGESILAPQARRFLHLLARFGLPPSAMCPAWGMSETCSGITYSHTFRPDSAAEDPFVSVGPPIAGVSLRIVDSDDHLLPEGEVGHLQVAGVPVTPGYAAEPEANQDVFTADGWFRTGDLARLRDGHLTVTGRAKDILIVNGRNFACSELEAVAGRVSGVEPGAIAAFATRLAGASTDEVVVVVAAQKSADPVEVVRKVRRRLIEDLGVAATWVVPVAAAELPRSEIGKIQRAPLRERFEAGEFDGEWRRIDRALGQGNELPRWFAREMWRPRAAVPQHDGPPPGCWLLLVDEEGVGSELARRIARAGAQVVVVRAGRQFESGPPLEYQVDPTLLAHHRRVLLDLQGRGVAIAGMVHLWSAGAEQGADLARGLHSLLLLVQAQVGIHGPTARVRLIHATREGTTCETAAAVGFLKTVERELSGWTCRTVHLGMGSPAEAARRLYGELCTPSRDMRVAYRGDERWVSRLIRADLTADSERPPALRPGAVYVVAGGGDVGRHLVSHLLERYGVRSIVLGRRLRLSSDDALLSIAADVTDYAALESAVAAAEEKLGVRLAGAFHLAGVLERGLISELTPERLRVAMAPKLDGARNLYRLLSRREGGTMVLFSSLNGRLGGSGLAAYAAANAALDAFAEAHSDGPVEVYTLGWSLWAGCGMSRGENLELSRSLGFYALRPAQALASLDVLLRRAPSQTWVGLDADNVHAGAEVDTDCRATQQIVARCVCDGVPAPTLPPSTDRFGAQVRLAVQRVEYLGRDTRGDRDPTGKAIELIASVWREVLDLPEVGFSDNFFDLGGHSLLLAQVQARLEDLFNREVSMVELFRHPTIESLGRLLATRAP